MNRIILILCLFALAGCIDCMHDPKIVSDFSYEVRIKGRISNIEFNHLLPPGVFLGQMESGREYEEIAIFKDDKVLYVIKQEDFDRMLSQNPHKEVIWELSENGIELISLEEAQRINKELFKPKKKIKK